MSTFSSVVNKSGKKFAPKTSVRRHVPGAGSQASGSARASTERQVTPQPRPTPDPALEEPTASAVKTVQPTISQPTATVKGVTEGATSIPIPRATNTLAPTEPGRRPIAPPVVQVSPNHAQDHTARPLSVPGASQNDSTSSQERAEATITTTGRITRGKSGQKGKVPATIAQTTVPPNQAHESTSTDASSVLDDTQPSRKRSRATRGNITVATSAEGESEPVSDLSQQPAQTGAATRRIQRRAQSNVAAASRLAAPPTSTRTTQETSRPTRKRRQKQSLAEVAAEIVGDAAGEGTETTKRQRKRHRIPENAEENVIIPSAVTMSDLCEDTGLGKKSKRESELENIDWVEVKKKRKEAEEEAERERHASRGNRKKPDTTVPNEVNAQAAMPQISIVNGQLVIDSDSRIVDRHAEAAKDTNAPTEAIDEESLTKRINQSTIGPKRGLRIRGRWDEEMTERFYHGLRIFGTDFMMISNMFPDMSRRHIKLKYIREERTNLNRVQASIKAREQVDMDEYAKMSNTVFEDPRKLEEELKEAEKIIRAQDEERRAQEANTEKAGEVEVLRSREQGSAEAGVVDEEEVTAEADSSAKENRFSSIARSVVNDATTQKKKRKTTLAKKRDARKARAMEGIEEVVGSIDDVQQG